MRFGFAVPIFANPGVADFRTPNAVQVDWSAIMDGVRFAESLGFDSLWVADHMFLGRDGAILEGWTTLSYLAGATTSMRLGPIHLGDAFRHAPLLAKMVATLDVISGGRLELFVDPGWREREHSAYGFQWEPDRARRVERLDAALDVMHEMWTQDSPVLHNDFFSIDGAICAPRPVAPDGPPIWIGEAFDEATLDLIARRADVWNSMPAGIDVVDEKIRRVESACRDRGRDPRTLRKTLETQVFIYESESEFDGLLERFARLAEEHPSGGAMSDVVEFVRQGNPRLDGTKTRDQLIEEFVIGTPEEVADKLAAYAELGIDEVLCWFMDYPETRSMELLAERVRPLLNAR